MWAKSGILNGRVRLTAMRLYRQLCHPTEYQQDGPTYELSRFSFFQMCLDSVIKLSEGKWPSSLANLHKQKRISKNRIVIVLRFTHPVVIQLDRVIEKHFAQWLTLIGRGTRQCFSVKH